MWFERWITEGYTIRQLSKQSGWSRATIQRILRYWLQHPPPLSETTITSKYVMFDGTFLHRRRGMFAVMDGVSHRIVCGAYEVNEGPRDLLVFCRKLKERGLEPKSATIDGNPHLFRIIQSLWPELLVQRCLVHVQRQGLSWCRQRPKRPNAQHLRRIFGMVLNIRSHKQRHDFQRAFDQWNKHYGRKLTDGSTRGWVTNDLQRARSMLINALPYMFAYLDDPIIPWSTNAIEGYYSRLKLRYRQHRGLRQLNRTNYFRWYFHLVPR